MACAIFSIPGRKGADMMDSNRAVLEIDNLGLEFPTYRGAVRAINGVSLRVAGGEIVGIVGESGSAKSVTAMTAMRLLPEGRFNVTSGSVTVLGRDTLAAREEDMVDIRGRDVAMIFQEPLTALNPTQRVARQMVEVIRRHRACSATEARQLATCTLLTPSRYCTATPLSSPVECASAS